MATKILFVITKATWGGAQSYVYDLARAVREAGYAVAVAYGESGLLVNRLESAGIRTIKIGSLERDMGIWREWRAFGQLLWITLAEEPDVLHLNSSKAGGLGALAGRLARVPRIIFTAHGWEFKGERPLLARIGIRFFSWTTMLLAHKTIAVSDAIARAVESWPGVRGRISVIRNGVETVPLLSRLEARAELTGRFPGLFATFATPEAFVIGSVSELIPIKGLIYGIRAIAMLPAEVRRRTYWIVMGEGKLWQALTAEIRKYSLEEQVFLIGFVPDAARYLKAFDSFLFPSLYEAIGYAILEAGQAGLAVVASRVGGVPEVIQDGVSGLLVPPHDPQAIARALTSLVDAPEKRRELGIALQRTIAKRFTKKEALARTIRLYQD